MRKIITLLVCLMVTIASLYSEEKNNIVRYDCLGGTSYIMLNRYEDGTGYYVSLYDTKDLTRRDMYYIEECEDEDGLILKFYTDLIDHKAWRNFTKEFAYSGLDINNEIFTIWKVHKITTK